MEPDTSGENHAANSGAELFALIEKCPNPAPMLKLIDAYHQALPPREFGALCAWLTTFYPFQLTWILESAQYAICCKSRQIGMSHCTGAALVLWSVFLGETSTIISVGEREATEVLDVCFGHASALHQLGSKWARPVRKGTQINFDGGGRVIALPASSGGRGFSGNVFLDEYAYVEKPAELWDAAAAVTTHGGKMRVASTPNGVGNEFHNLYTNPRANAGWKKHEFPLQLALSQGMRVDIEKCRINAKGDERLFNQLYNCDFLDGNAQYIPTDLVKRAVVDNTYCYDGVPYGGLDIGRSHDLSVLYIVKRDALGVRWVQNVYRTKRTSQTDLDAMVAKAMYTHNVQRLAVDSTGLGTFPTENYQRIYGENRVQAVNFTLQTKEALATGMYQAFADCTVKLQAGDDKIVHDVCAIRRIITDAGHVRYDAPHNDEGHADDAWSLALALFACSAKPNVRNEVFT